MPANTNPISPITPSGSWNPIAILTSNVALNGTGTVGTDIELIFTAGANGARIPRVRVVHRGSNVATVLRIFQNNGATNATPSNNSLLSEETIAANTLSQVAKSVFYDIYINAVLKPTYRLYYTIGTNVAAGHAVSTPDAGDY
jgi:hypothetical protein